MYWALLRALLFRMPPWHSSMCVIWSTDVA